MLLAVSILINDGICLSRHIIIAESANRPTNSHPVVVGARRNPHQRWLITLIIN